MRHLLRCILSTLFILSAFGQAFSQAKLTIRIDSMPGNKEDKVYLAGAFSGWNPADSHFQFRAVGSSLQLTVPVTSGNLQFKITRGSWDKEEAGADGQVPGNRSIAINNDSSISIKIAGWKDQFSTQKRKSTASSRVRVLEESMYIPQLNRHRRIWIYLPPGYEKGNKKFPVLYMHDAQNLFDDTTSFSGEWNVDEAMDSMANGQEKMAIVVGIENGDKRITEYNPYNHKDYGNGEGVKYVDFIVKTLKPYIDNRFRTLRSRENTFIAGSSLGGLISYYAVLKYPKVFGGAGIFSPSFWIAKEIEQYTAQRKNKLDARLYFYAGGAESKTMVLDMAKIIQQFGGSKKVVTFSALDRDGKHNETTWRKHFPAFYAWIIAK